MAVIKDLGAVTAYAAAVEGGYTGTKAEFATLMASYATVAEEAAESAESASQSASAASASAQTATTKAGEASTSATQASASATSASQSAQTATTKASEASASASTAGTKASEASQSATTASSKASEASASATSAQTAQGLAESARDDAIDAKTDAESARDLAQQYAESIDPEKIYSAYPTDTASGAVATFTDGADDIPMKSVKVAIEPVQDLHGQESPYPAGGGKNLFDGYMVSTSAPNNWGASFANDALTITHKNEYTSGIPQISLNFPAGTYVISFASQTKTASISLYVDGSYNTVLRPEDTFTVADGHTYAIIFYADVGTPNIITKIQIEKGDTPTAYAPYSNICPISGWTGAQVSHSGADRTNPTTYSITFPSEAGTVYGGTLDVTNGTLTVDRAFIASYNGETLPAEWISDRDKYVAGTTPTTGAQVCYKLSQAVVYTLTPTVIKSLLGDNNLWADAGDTTVTYRADTAKYIDKKIAEVINALS